MHLRVCSTGSPSLQLVRLPRVKIITKLVLVGLIYYLVLVIFAHSYAYVECGIVDVAFDKYYPCNTCTEIEVDICKHITVLCLNDINIILTIASLQP